MPTPDEVGRRLGSAVEAARERLMQRVTLAVEGAVKVRTPVLTGNLRRSITSRVERSGERGVVGTSVIYARVVNRRAQFMERGLDDAQRTIGRILEDEGARIMGEIGQ